MKVKGSILRSLPIFVRRRHGQEAYKKVLDSLSPKARELFDSPALLSQWYPAGVGLIEPTQRLCEILYDGDDVGAFEAGCFSSEFTLRGIYKPMVKVGTVSWLIKRSSRFVGLYYDHAQSNHVKNAPNDYSFFVKQNDDIHAVIERRLQGWLHKALEISLSRPGRIDIVQSQSRGDETSEYHCTWD